jgi:hypothetical protein
VRKEGADQEKSPGSPSACTQIQKHIWSNQDLQEKEQVSEENKPKIW